MQKPIPVVIAGAGPYGLSLSAHLAGRGVPHRIFGAPMDSWRNHMPTGMLLKSDGFASNLSDPRGEYPLSRFCAERGLPYDDTRIPVSLEVFSAYGVAFQQRFVPHLEDRQIVHVERAAHGFRIRLQDGEELLASRLVAACGITHFARVPGELAHLSGARLSTGFAAGPVEQYRGRNVTVIGAGASAIDLAVLLHEQGTQVTLLARGHELHFHAPPPPNGRPLCARLRHPSSGLGPGLRSRLYWDAPQLFHALPRAIRLRIVNRHLRASAGWPMRERIEGRVPMLLGHTVEAATESVNGVCLELRAADGARREHHTEFVITATGFQVEVERLAFLDAALRAQIRTEAAAPALSADFESSVQGLYFTGPAAATSFGPVFRFVYGSAFAARRLAKHLAQQTGSARTVPSASAVPVSPHPIAPGESGQ